MDTPTCFSVTSSRDHPSQDLQRPAPMPFRYFQDPIRETVEHFPIAENQR